MKFSALILAGGQSRRMGRDKAELIRNGKTLLEQQVELVRSLGAAEILISGRPGVSYNRYDLRVLHDRTPDSGPLGGIERALDAATQPLLLVLAVDMAEMTVKMLRELTARCCHGRGVIPRVNGRIEPLAAIYAKAAWPDAVAVLAGESKSATAFAHLCVESGRANFCEINKCDAGCFKSWNAPKDIPFESQTTGRLCSAIHFLASQVACSH